MLIIDGDFNDSQFLLAGISLAPIALLESVLKYPCKLAVVILTSLSLDILIRGVT